ncbi:MAG: sulfide/dihydroorotate dehydrogenase-like FAD/NAD-binding protein [Candidatus Omnitrophica bacterium]|nr:sulfide/dihydroorotate dehydrogenase-like FAD/NAD-binding protein [Candidatus Omnitrophota bacterium]
MFKIYSNEKIAAGIFKMILEAPLVSATARPGQFMMIRIDEQGERIPLTIADISDKTITIVYQIAGVTTYRLTEKKAGEYVSDVVGPLGHATDTDKIGTVCCVGGGVGIAELYPVAKAYKNAGNSVIIIIGARNKELLIFKKELEFLDAEMFVVTDDGSFGEKGFVTDVLKRLLDSGRKMEPTRAKARGSLGGILSPDLSYRGECINLVYAVGPGVMMEAVSNLTRPYGVKTLVSLNTVLVDGTGMCGSCRIQVGTETKFACVDGPEFDGHLVNFKELKARQSLFKEQENHACKIRGIIK